MNAAIQTKTDQAIRTLSPEQLAEYAVREKWGHLKALWEKRITETEAEESANTFSRKFLNPMPGVEYQKFSKAYDRLNRAEEMRSSFSVSFGLMADTISLGQALLTAMDRLMDVAYTVQEGRSPWPEDLEWTTSFSEKILIPAIILLEKRKADLREMLETMPEYVAFPPDQELIPTPQEVREYMAKEQAGEEYMSDLTDPFEMPRVRFAKRLGVETEGRTYGEVCKQVRDALYNVDRWDEPTTQDT